MNNLHHYRSLGEFRKADPQLSRELYQLARKIEHGCMIDDRAVPPWPRIAWWMCKMIEPPKDGSRLGADPLQVQRAMQAYLAAPEKFHNWPDGPWALLQHIALDHKTAVRVDEIRWDKYKKEDRASAGRNLQSVGALLAQAMQAGATGEAGIAGGTGR
jgi:hypothetical protein